MKNLGDFQLFALHFWAQHFALEGEDGLCEPKRFFTQVKPGVNEIIAVWGIRGEEEEDCPIPRALVALRDADRERRTIGVMTSLPDYQDIVVFGSSPEPLQAEHVRHLTRRTRELHRDEHSMFDSEPCFIFEGGAVLDGMASALTEWFGNHRGDESPEAWWKRLTASERVTTAISEILEKCSPERT